MAAKEYKGPKRFAHRGLVQYAPENTVEAFAAAIDRGFEGIEIDIGISADGEPIVAHDSGFKRMTKGSASGTLKAKLCDMKWEDIVKVDLPYANHLLPKKLPPLSKLELLAAFPKLVPGERADENGVIDTKTDKRTTHLTRFSDFDEWFATRPEDVIIEIEIKAKNIMPRMLEILDNSKNNARYIVFSGNREIIDEIQAEVKAHGKPDGLRLGANIRFLTDSAKAFVEKSDLFEIGLNAGHIKETDIAWLKEHGVNVFSNLGDYPDWWEKLIKLDVMGFKTNYAEAYTEWWNNRE